MTDWLWIRDFAPDDFAVVSAVESAFAAAGTPLRSEDFAFGTLLGEAFNITVGLKLNIQDPLSRQKLDRVLRLASELSESLKSIISEATEFADYHSKGRAYPHVALAKFLDTPDDITGNHPHSVSSTISTLTNLIDLAGQAATVGTVVAGRGPKPNLAYERFRTLLQQVYTAKTGKIGIKVDGEYASGVGRLARGDANR